MITCVLLPSLPRLCSGRSPQRESLGRLALSAEQHPENPRTPRVVPQESPAVVLISHVANCSSEKVGWHPTPGHHDMPVIETGRSH